MNQAEFDYWSAVTASSKHKWVEDEIYRHNGRGSFYYTGGEDGIYIEATKEGQLQYGRYEGAIPHIGEAIFMPAETLQFASYSAAYNEMLRRCGVQFLVDMFSPDNPIPFPRDDTPEMEL